MNALVAYQEIIAEHTSVFLTEFSKHSKNSIESYLEMCRVVCIAKGKLSKAEFAYFCDQIGEAGSKSSVSKMCSIGNRYSLFKDHIDQLPSAWTTLYTLATIPEDKLALLLSDDIINRQIDGKQAKALLPSKTIPETATASPEGAVKVGAVDGVGDVPSASNTTSSIDDADQLDSAGQPLDSGSAEPPTNSVACASGPAFSRQYAFKIGTSESADEFHERLVNELVAMCDRLNADLYEFDEV